MKHKLSFFSILFVAVSMPQVASAFDFYYVYQGKILYYNITGNTAQVTYQYDSNPRYANLTGVIEIPEYVMYNGIMYNVTSIGDMAFYGCTGITSISIPSSVTSIGNNAFTYCSGLTSISIPNSVTSIGYFAFSNCSGLVSVNISNFITTLENFTFAGCSNLASVTIPNGITTLGHAVFAGCSNLTSVIVPNSVDSMGNGVFENCSALTSAVLPNDLTSISENTFYGCTELTSIVLPDSINTIGSYSFYNCSNLGSIVVPNNVTEIRSYAFKNCSGMTSVTIGREVTSIGVSAFENCSSLNEIISLAAVAPYMPNNAFSGIPSSVTINIPCGSLIYYNSWIYPYGALIEDSVGFTLSIWSNDLNLGNVIVINRPTCQNPTAVIFAKPTSSSQFVCWGDGNTENPRTLTLISDTNFTAYFVVDMNDTVYVHDTIIVHDTTYISVHDTTTVIDTLWLTDSIFIHDTIYIHDTIVTDVDEVEAINAKVYTSYRQIVVENTNGNTVWIYDVSGRVLATKNDEDTPLHFDVPSSGAYLVKIGNHPARKVVVIR